MIKMSELAQKKVIDAINECEEPVLGIRITADAKSPFQVEYGIQFMPPDGKLPGDDVVKFNRFDVYINENDARFLEGATIDYENSLMGSGFRFKTQPNIPKEYRGTMAEKVLQVIEQEINPSIAGHGGYINLIDVKENNVYIEMGGGCQGCGMSQVTLRRGVVSSIKRAVPEIEEIIDITDHDSGVNPYYK